jgi:GcrA cell cycle regulator
MSWNDERVELLKKLWSEGLSASQIASRLGSVTRNAVIGKVHRLGLSGRATTSRMKTHRQRPRANPVKKLAKPRFASVGNPAVRTLFQGDAEPYVPPAEELVIPPAERKCIQTLLENHCRWPIGDPQEEEFHFCGKTKVTGLPYCEFHARRAFQPPQSRRGGSGYVRRDVASPVVAPHAPAAATEAPASDDAAAAPKEPVDV